MSFALGHRPAQCATGGTRLSKLLLNRLARNPNLLILTAPGPGQHLDRFGQETIRFSTYAYEQIKKNARVGHVIVFTDDHPMHAIEKEGS